MELADLIMLDLKQMDKEEHKRGTGVDNGMILENLERLMSGEKFFVVRIPLIPGFNDSERNLEAVAERLAPARGKVRVELLPCNPFAGAKYPMVGRRYESIYQEGAEPRLDLEPFRSTGIEAVIL
jgi:pyruvate formate lyase activating enzyme